MATREPVNTAAGASERPDTEPTRLARRLAERIAARGPMTFRDFMEAALYEPEAGYYQRPQTAWSSDADYVTAPQVDAAFGTAVARLACECDAALGQPNRFDLLDWGGGDGSLLADTCDALRQVAPALYERLAVTSIERGDAARLLQQRRLARHADRITWRTSIEELSDGALRGLLVSNELLDAFPVHRVVLRDGELREICVDARGDKLVEVETPPSTPALSGYLADNGIELAEGQVAEINLAVRSWVESVARALAAGFVLTVDYGAATESLYDAARTRGSLVCQHRYQLNQEPLERVGLQDITAHVDFGNLRRCGQAVGLGAVGEIGLAGFLVGFGATAVLAEDAAAGGGAEALRRRLGLRHLLFSEIADAHRAVLQCKAVKPIAFGLERLS